MTPYELIIILNAHASPAQPYDRKEAPIYHETMGNLVGLGLFVTTGSELANDYAPTEKLHAYAKCLCMMPLPVQNWTIPGATFFAVA